FMKALVAKAEWAPKDAYVLSENEEERRRANVGSQVWRDPIFEILDIPVPDIKEDEVLVHVKVCGICGSDTHVYETDEEGYMAGAAPAASI
ncbi:hypothetical protein ACFL5Z_18300, partial [Planctomycetota bacterium]